MHFAEKQFRLFYYLSGNKIFFFASEVKMLPEDHFFLFVITLEMKTYLLHCFVEKILYVDDALNRTSPGECSVSE